MQGEPSRNLESDAPVQSQDEVFDVELQRALSLSLEASKQRKRGRSEGEDGEAVELLAPPEQSHVAPKWQPFYLSSVPGLPSPYNGIRTSMPHRGVSDDVAVSEFVSLRSHATHQRRSAYCFCPAGAAVERTLLIAHRAQVACSWLRAGQMTWLLASGLPLTAAALTQSPLLNIQAPQYARERSYPPLSPHSHLARQAQGRSSSEPTAVHRDRGYTRRRYGTNSALLLLLHV
jgi:hypothetical protein